MGRSFPSLCDFNFTQRQVFSQNKHFEHNTTNSWSPQWTTCMKISENTKKNYKWCCGMLTPGMVGTLSDEESCAQVVVVHFFISVCSYRILLLFCVNPIQTCGPSHGSKRTHQQWPQCSRVQQLCSRGLACVADSCPRGRRRPWHNCNQSIRKKSTWHRSLLVRTD